MNRKQRRAAESAGNAVSPQAFSAAQVLVQGKAYSLAQANQLALDAYGQGKLEAALAIFQAMAASVPTYGEAYYSQGFILQMMGKQQEAMASYDKAIALHPGHAEAHDNRGVILQEMKRYNEALISHDKAIKIKPGLAIAHNNRGEALRQLERYSEALVSYNKAIALNPENAVAYNNRGATFKEMKRYVEALADYDKAIALNPGYADAHINRGALLQEIKRYDEALQSTDKAVALNQDSAIAYNSRGNILRYMRRYDASLASFERAVALKPDYAEAYNNRGVSFQELRQYSQAIACYDDAVKCKPDYAEAYDNRGVAQQKLKQYIPAMASYEQAIALNPDIKYLTGKLAGIKMNMCDWKGLDELFAELLAKIAAGEPVSDPFSMLAMPFTPTQLSKAVDIYIKDKYPPADIALWKGEKYRHDRIRIGYFSSDLCIHAVSILMAGLFEQHDRSKFEVAAFSFGPPTDDDMRKRVENAFEYFIDVHDKSDQEIAALARKMEIDIAIDLNGFTQDARPEIFALRPVPVQVNYLGYPDTMCADYIDYIIADKFVIPPQSRKYYSEKVVYLPECFQANDDKRFFSDARPSRKTYGLPEEGFVFCTFNNTYKINPTFFDIWMRLLTQVPGSVLWLLGDDVVQQHLQAEAANRGVDPSRLIFAPRMKYEDHLVRLRCADLFLDTLPFNAGTTASDALWTGMPLLTCAGEGFAARMAGSLLTTVGLPELIVSNLKDYEALALELATHPQKLSAMRNKIEQGRTGTSLFNTKLFARRFEAALVQMHERTMAGLPPEDIVLQA